MTDLMLKNGLIYVVIEDYCHYYKSYEPITIYSDGVESITIRTKVLKRLQK